ncbi:hypothetical protein [Rhodococcoides kyotonense]|uniref:Uncharacterized protein n=1 Tax=Rhodococcoides kyotonense TaxID=398843 RepID=A0A239MXQ7_9NOCA|nr:hypothetical protein [Rhodococcus kyotonensis]SNT46649.1 hypothetical protein SAMN05421642_12342 [Rhodococcus kyotonensis]
MGFVTFLVCLLFVVGVITVGVSLYQLYDVTNTTQKKLDKWALKAVLVVLAVGIVVDRALCLVPG